MPRRYNIPFTGTWTNSGGNFDLFTVEPADDKPCTLVGIWLGQTSELGDTAEESLGFSVIHMTATVTNSNGTSTTPIKAGDQGQAAAGFTAEAVGATVSTTSGTSTIIGYFSWNVRASPTYIAFDDILSQIRAVQGEAIIVRCDSTPADDITGQVVGVVDEW